MAAHNVATLLRFLAGYRDALVFAAKALKVELTPEKHAHLMEAYLKRRCWPDVPAALSLLKKAGLRLAFLSNLTAKMLEAGIRNSQLDGVFDHALSHRLREGLQA